MIAELADMFDVDRINADLAALATRAIGLDHLPTMDTTGLADLTALNDALDALDDETAPDDHLNDTDPAPIVRRSMGEAPEKRQGLRVPDQRRPGERDRAWSHYIAYRDMEGRSLRKTAAAQGVGLRWVKELSRRWSWLERAAEYDAWRDAAIVEVRTRMRLAAAALEERLRARRRAENQPPSPASVREREYQRRIARERWRERGAAARAARRTGTADQNRTEAGPDYYESWDPSKGEFQEWNAEARRHEAAAAGDDR